MVTSDTNEELAIPSTGATAAPTTIPDEPLIPPNYFDDTAGEQTGDGLPPSGNATTSAPSPTPEVPTAPPSPADPFARSPQQLAKEQQEQQALIRQQSRALEDARFNEALRARATELEHANWTQEQIDYYLNGLRQTRTQELAATNQVELAQDQANMSIVAHQAKVFTAMELAKESGATYFDLMQADTLKEMQNLSRAFKAESELRQIKTGRTPTQAYTGAQPSAGTSNAEFERRMADPNYSPTQSDYERYSKMVGYNIS